MLNVFFAPIPRNVRLATDSSRYLLSNYVRRQGHATQG